MAASGAVSPLGSVVGVDESGQVPVVYSFSLGSTARNRELAPRLDMAYVGTLSRHLVTSRNIKCSFPLATHSHVPLRIRTNYEGGVVPAVGAQPASRCTRAAGYNFSGD